MDKLLLSLMYSRSLKLRNDHDDVSFNDDAMVTRNRSKVTFTLPNLISHFYKRSPYYRGVVLWNTLDAGVQRATSKVKFKLEIDKIKDLRSKIKKGYN